MSQRFTSSAAYQYFHPLHSLIDLSIYIQQKLCSQLRERCFDTAASIKYADYVDMDFDAISQVFTLSIFHHKPPNSDSWHSRISNRGGQNTVEVGVLTNEPTKEIVEQSLGGFLTVVGEDEIPSI